MGRGEIRKYEKTKRDIYYEQTESYSVEQFCFYNLLCISHLGLAHSIRFRLWLTFYIFRYILNPCIFIFTRTAAPCPLTCPAPPSAHFCDIAPLIGIGIIAFYWTKALPWRSVVATNSIQLTWGGTKGACQLLMHTQGLAHRQRGRHCSLISY